MNKKLSVIINELYEFALAKIFSFLVVTCPALALPAHGGWQPADCGANSQVCRSVCLLRCDTVNGFQLEGPDRRDCQPNGQWSTPWNSYCKGRLHKVVLSFPRRGYDIYFVHRSRSWVQPLAEPKTEDSVFPKPTWTDLGRRIIFFSYFVSARRQDPVLVTNHATNPPGFSGEKFHPLPEPIRLHYLDKWIPPLTHWERKAWYKQFDGASLFKKNRFWTVQDSFQEAQTTKHFALLSLSVVQSGILLCFAWLVCLFCFFFFLRFLTYVPIWL